MVIILKFWQNSKYKDIKKIQNLLADAESNICKYNAVIISDITLF